MARINTVLLDDGPLVFDGNEAATVQCVALAPSACHSEAVPALGSQSVMFDMRIPAAMTCINR
jgi:hypothetical protein